MVDSDIQQKMQHLILLYERAISLVSVNISKLEKEDPILNKILINQLRNGLDVLKCGLEKRRRIGIEEIVNTPYRKRAGRGLSRGFGEFLYNIPDEPWIDEIMAAVRAIEFYYAAM